MFKGQEENKLITSMDAKFAREILAIFVHRFSLQAGGRLAFLTLNQAWLGTDRTSEQLGMGLRYGCDQDWLIQHHESDSYEVTEAGRGEA